MAGNNELEKTLWAAADKLRSNMDAAEYKHIVLGLIFLKYISDAFSDLHEQLKVGQGEFEGADPELNKQRLGELIDLIGTIGFNQSGHQVKDLLGRVYEYFLGQFADAEGKKGGQFYTPASIVKLLVAMLEPTKAVFMTAVAARAACSCRASASWRNIRVTSKTCLSMVRNQTPPRCGWPR
jgi:type I restriction enzyme M protein